MKHYNLNTTQRKILAGFTDLFIISYTDFTSQTTNNTAQSATLLSAMAFGDWVDQPETLLEVVTAGAGDATLTLDVGVTGALTQIISGQNGLSAAKTAYSPTSGVAPYPVPTGGKDLLVTAHPGAAEALSALSAGEWWLWMKRLTYNDRIAGVQA